MILGCRDKRTAQFAAGERIAAFSGFDRQAHKRLEILAAATSVADLRGLPSNRLEALRGDRAGRYSIRINDQWRICFEWPRDAAGPFQVELSIITERRAMVMTRPAIHPGEILADELEEIGITPTELARQINVPPNRVTQIIHGRRAITGDTALRLGHWFRTSAEFWLNLQAAYDLRLAEQAAGAEIEALSVRPEPKPQPLQPGMP